MHGVVVQRILWIAMILLPLGLGPAIAGTLRGTVTESTGQRRIKDAVVWAEPIGPMPEFPPPAAHAEMAQRNLAFTPRLLPVLVGTTVDFPNRDQVYHSVFSFSRHQRFEIGLYKPGMSRSVRFDKVGPVKLFCNIHDNMYGTILVLPTPYFGVTTADGSFSIGDIPAGEYTVKIWHKRLQGTPQTVSISAGETTEIGVMLRSKRRRRTPK